MNDFDLTFEIDVDALASQIKDLKEEFKAELTKGIGNVAAMTHGKLLDLANDEMHSLAQKYKDAVSFRQVDDTLWIVSLDASALWIEEGRKCVVYGNSKMHKPKVLTPDGEIFIDKLKKGMLVLNQYGKWTEVIDIYDELLVEKSKFIPHKVEICNFCPENNKLNKRKHLVCFKMECAICGKIQKWNKYNSAYKKIRCQECFKKQKLVKIEISGHLNSSLNSGSCSTLILTEDHKIMTQLGWIEAKDINPNLHKIQIPSWNKCKTCDKPTYLYNNFCYDKNGSPCSGKYTILNTLKNGNHQCQKPDARANYLKTLLNTIKENKTEKNFEELVKKIGFSVDFYNKNINMENIDCIREYPSITKPGVSNWNQFYYIDFYFPNLNLAIEVDGKAFHCEKRDKKRDAIIKNNLKCDIIRIPSKNVWKKDFLEKTLIPILKNHSDEINYLPFNSYKVSKFNSKKYSGNNRRWDITVKEGESFVCQGMLIHNSGFQEELLHGKSSKVSKDGTRYAVIPFEHSKAPSQQTSSAKQLTDQIKSELKKRNISYKKIEYGADGSPRLGLIHKFDIESARPSRISGITKASHPALSGVSIYQRKMPGGKIKRDIMTFRVISEKSKAEGKWVHPGMVGYKLMDKSLDWAFDLWEREILPDIIKKFN
jgi:hypothetical protein